MFVKNHLKHLALLLTLCVLLAAFCASFAVSAGSVLDADAICSLTVNVCTDFQDATPEDFEVLLYKIADLNGDATLRAVENEFVALESYLKPVDGAYQDHELARKALTIAASIERDPDETGVVGEKIDGLTTGLYLVVVRGADQEAPEYVYNEDGDAVSTEATVGLYKYTFDPVLLSLPFYEKKVDEEGEVTSAEWVYDMTVSFKAERDMQVGKKLTLHKVDATDRQKPLPGAKFELYSTRWASDNIPEKTITAFVEGKGFLPLYYMGTYETDENGNIVADAPVWDDSTLYAWVETKAPEGYELDPTPHFFFAYGEYAHPSGRGAYEDWMNEKGRYMDTMLRYSSNNGGNDSGMVTFNRTVGDEGQNVVTITNNGTEPIFVKVGAYKSVEYIPQLEEDEEALLTEFQLEAFGDGWYGEGEGDYFYNELLQPGETTEPLSVQCAKWMMEPGSMTSYAGRYALTYDFSPVFYSDWFVDDEGNMLPHSDYDWDPREPIPGGEDGEWIYEPLPESKWGVKVTGSAVKVARSDYAIGQEDGENGVTITNEPTSEETPPDGMELPETGGFGTFPYILGGSGLMAISLFLFAVRKRIRA